MLFEQWSVVKIATVLVLVHTGHHVDPAGHADGGCVVMVVERDAVVRKAVDVRRLDVLVPVAA